MVTDNKECTTNNSSVHFSECSPTVPNTEALEFKNSSFFSTV